jgi:hypothetical protein
MAAAAAVLLGTGALPRWLGWVGAALGWLSARVLSVWSPDSTSGPPITQCSFLMAAWVAVLAFCLGWPLPSATGRADEALD